MEHLGRITVSSSLLSVLIATTSFAAENKVGATPRGTKIGATRHASTPVNNLHTSTSVLPEVDTASAPEQQTDRSKPIRPRRRWYGWQTLVADGIIAAQVREIREMKALIEDIERNGLRGERVLPARPSAVEPKVMEGARQIVRGLP